MGRGGSWFDILPENAFLFNWDNLCIIVDNSNTDIYSNSVYVAMLKLSCIKLNAV